MENFKQYQISKGNAENTVRAQVNTAKAFEAWAETKQLNVQKTTYNDLMEFVESCRTQGNQTHTLRLKVKALEHYFNYLSTQSWNETTRSTWQNPATLIKLKGGTQKIPTKLLSSEELLEIYHAFQAGGLAAKRNKVLLSLCIFQGVASTELSLLEVSDVDLMQGTVYVPSTRSTNSRTLELRPFQLLLFQDYLQNIRPEIIRLSGQPTQKLLVNSSSGKGVMTNTISILLGKLHDLYPKLESLQQIRQSVITLWIREHGLRKAQYMAGHRYVSSTERYDVKRDEELQEELRRFYPK